MPQPSDFFFQVKTNKGKFISCKVVWINHYLVRICLNYVCVCFKSFFNFGLRCLLVDDLHSLIPLSNMNALTFSLRFESSMILVLTNIISDITEQLDQGRCLSINTGFIDCNFILFRNSSTGATEVRVLLITRAVLVHGKEELVQMNPS